MNIPFHCSIYSGNVGVNFYSDVNLIEEFSKFSSNKFIPEFSLSEQMAPSEYSVFYTNSGSHKLHWEPCKAVAAFPIEMIKRRDSILQLGYPFIELQRQQRSGITIHAAACSIGNQGVLLLGKEGSGKTSTLIRLCQEYRAKLIANDLTLLQLHDQSVYLTGGTKFFYLRYASVLKSLPHITPFFQRTEGIDSWTTKTFLQPNQLNIETNSDPVPMKRAYLVHVDEDQKNLIIKPANSLADKLYINENFSRYIRNTCTTFLGGEEHNYFGFIPSLDTEELYLNRLKLMNILFNQANLIYISGKSNEIAEYIYKGTEFCV